MKPPQGTRTGGRIKQGRDRFQAFAVPCSGADEALEAVRVLTASCGLEDASHLSWALRPESGGSIMETKSDGGETGAGACILDVLRKRNVTNTLVLVARWYGGRHLGSLRFRI
ncbi:MAG: YigZ family protein [Candidatus Fermentibacteraceae bacterium]|nr:YigZ family protein [Candidatus Fermentibacteraceae bacterium]